MKLLFCFQPHTMKHKSKYIRRGKVYGKQYYSDTIDETYPVAGIDNDTHDSMTTLTLLRQG